MLPSGAKGQAGRRGARVPTSRPRFLQELEAAGNSEILGSRAGPSGWSNGGGLRLRTSWLESVCSPQSWSAGHWIVCSRPTGQPGAQGQGQPGAERRASPGQGDGPSPGQGDGASREQGDGASPELARRSILSRWGAGVSRGSHPLSSLRAAPGPHHRCATPSCPHGLPRCQAGGGRCRSGRGPQLVAGTCLTAASCPLPVVLCLGQPWLEATRGQGLPTLHEVTSQSWTP